MLVCGQNEKNLLLVDNAPSHLQLSLKKVKVVFLLPNNTSVELTYGPGII